MINDDERVGKPIKEMDEEELLTLRNHLYTQLKDFSMDATKSEFVLKRMRSINLRLAKIT